MGRPKGTNKNLDKVEQDSPQKAIVEAIKDKWQACLKALEQSLPLAVLSIVQELAGFRCPSRPSLPLAQASKLAAHCAITLHLRREHYSVPEPKLQEVVLNLINKATVWAWEGGPHILLPPVVLFPIVLLSSHGPLLSCIYSHACSTPECLGLAHPSQHFTINKHLPVTGLN